MELQMREFLRDRAPDEEEWQQQVEALRRQANESVSAEDRARAMGRLGEQLRLRPETVQDAVDTLRTPVALAEESGDAKLLTANRLRLAIALQYANRNQDALSEHERVINLIDKYEVDGLRDFALQHLGKCYVEMGRLAEARDCFERALAIRREGGTSDLVQSTLEAMEGLNGQDSTFRTQLD